MPSNFRDDYTLVTGGAGFIGTNLADRLLTLGRRVVIYDNFSRSGVEQNAQWLQEKYGPRVQIQKADIRDTAAVRAAVSGASQVFHFAAQVAVTSSLEDPRNDFEINAAGTVNLLEALRGLSSPPPVLYTSTNKVYGGLEDVTLRTWGRRYEPNDDETMRANGIDERRALDFHTPYGCSKGAAEQYVLDYARSFHAAAVVFRMSCIYGPHQFGTEDQGWVAHFCIRALENRQIAIYGDGMQVRDVLFVDDLIDAMLLAQENMPSLSGQAFNIGGGPKRTVSLLELLDIMAVERGEKLAVRFEPVRTGDQRYYVSNTSKFQTATGWEPRVGVKDGLSRLFQWLAESRQSMPVTVAAGR